MAGRQVARLRRRAAVPGMDGGESDVGTSELPRPSDSEWRGASRLGAHSIRRGAAGAIREAGFFPPQLLRPGQWRSSAYQLYLELGREESRTIDPIMVEAAEGEWQPSSFLDLEVLEVRTS